MNSTKIGTRKERDLTLDGKDTASGTRRTWRGARQGEALSCPDRGAGEEAELARGPGKVGQDPEEAQGTDTSRIRRGRPTAHGKGRPASRPPADDPRGRAAEAAHAPTWTRRRPTRGSTDRPHRCPRSRRRPRRCCPCRSVRGCARRGSCHSGPQPRPCRSQTDGG